MNPFVPLTMGTTGAFAYALTGSNEVLMLAGAFALAYLCVVAFVERSTIPEQTTLTDYEN